MTREQFYKEDPQRKTSDEWDFGAEWRKSYVYPTYRISYVVATKELIAVNLSYIDDCIEILGTVPQQEIESLLRGHEHVMGEIHSVDWIKTRLKRLDNFLKGGDLDASC